MDWKSIVGSLAPVLGGALGGPFGALAGNWLKGAVLGDTDAEDEALAKAVMNADPDTIMKIKNAEQTFLIKLQELGLEREQLVIEDRASARQLFTVDKRPQIILSVVFVGGYFILVYALMTGGLKVDAGQQIQIASLIGVLTAGVANIMQFWFGSSSGSKDKDMRGGV